MLKEILIIIRNLDGFISTYCSYLFPRKYQIIGKCKQCGICCTEIAIHLSDTFWSSKFLLNLIIKFFDYLYNFEYIGFEKKQKIILFKCNHLKNNKCSIYNKRPYICRNYPLPRYFEKPKIPPNCGFQAKLKK